MTGRSLSESGMTRSLRVDSIGFCASQPLLAEKPIGLAGSKRIGPTDFELLCVIGMGAFGKVIQVKHTSSQEVLAMKIVTKSFLVKRKSVAYMQAERDIMTKINHPFIVRLKYAFQTPSSVYLVMPFIAGGELFHHLQEQCMMTEEAVRFYAAEMVLALEHLHAAGIIHRDLKPENILLGADGHIQLTDFGLATSLNKEDDSATTVCGTCEYMSPEMIRGVAYNQAVDWWALGALIFEMLTGKPPFRHKNRKTLHKKILTERLLLPKYLSSSTHSILKALLDRNVDKRLGSGKSTMFAIKGVQAIKNHAFFKNIDWHKLARKKVTPPIIPTVMDTTDTQNFDKEFTNMKLDDDEEKSPATLCRLFSKFSYVADEDVNEDVEVNEENLVDKNFEAVHEDNLRSHEATVQEITSTDEAAVVHEDNLRSHEDEVQEKIAPTDEASVVHENILYPHEDEVTPTVEAAVEQYVGESLSP